MPVLVLAEHDDASVKSATLHAVTAARQLGDAVDVLVLATAQDAKALAQALAAVQGVAHVLVGE
ncbi:MAG TPA: electron transfer flavoprotein subunit alpha/FixB family protein, partial [Casimicrobiaceae bacterium]|nr:electron transfer flavoprotein subunit alpha/FixB family protein [Casimicrobiaceae bacterium]